MEVTLFVPKVVKSLLLPMQEVRILPICDIQYGAKGCDIDRLKSHIQWGLDNDCYFVGLGDYVDVASPSNRRKFASANLYDSVRDAMDSVSERFSSELIEILKPTKGRWLGLLSGHHYWEFQDGTTTDTRLAHALNAPYLGDGAAKVILQMAYTPKTGRTIQRKLVEAHIWLHHGVGQGRMPGGGVNPLYHISSRIFAHIYLMGHRHSKEAVKLPWVNHHVTKNGVVHEYHLNRVLAVCGGFLAGYKMGSTNASGLPAAGYVEKAMLPPTALGGVMVYVRPKLDNGTGIPLIDVDVSI